MMAQIFQRVQLLLCNATCGMEFSDPLFEQIKVYVMKTHEAHGRLCIHMNTFMIGLYTIAAACPSYKLLTDDM